MSGNKSINSFGKIALITLISLLTIGSVGIVFHLYSQTPLTPVAQLTSTDTPLSPTFETQTAYIWPATWTPTTKLPTETDSPRITWTPSIPAQMPTPIGTVVPIKIGSSRSFSGNSNGSTPFLNLEAGEITVYWSYNGSPAYKPSANDVAYHEQQIDFIKNIHQPMINLINQWIMDATSKRDAISLSTYQNMLNQEIQQMNNEIAAENKRYENYINNLAASDKTVFSIWSSQPDSAGLKQRASRNGPGTGQFKLQVSEGIGTYFSIQASGHWSIQITLK